MADRRASIASAACAFARAAAAAASSSAGADPGRRRSRRRRRRRRARARTRAASRSCRPSPCRRRSAARQRPASSARQRRAVCVEHARRRAGDRPAAARFEPCREMSGERIGVHVEQPAVVVGADARDDRHEAVADQRRAAAACPTRSLGTPTRPRSTIRPSTVRWGGAASDSPHARVRAGQPDRGARPPASSAATNRVLTAPASTETTTSSVGSSVIRSPSTCRFSMPAALSAASISLPPPCTTTSGVAGAAIRDDARATTAVAAAPDPRAARRRT